MHRPFLVPRAPIVPSSSASSHEEINPTNNPTVTSQVGAETRKKQVRWSHAMDNTLIDTLVEIVLSRPKRSGNGFKNDECEKVVKKIKECCHMVISTMHVRGRLKTLKNDYRDISELFKTRGFGLDANGRVTSDHLVWEKYSKENPHAKDLRGKLCPRYQDLATIFGNDTATGFQIVLGNDFEQMTPNEINNPVSLEDEYEVDQVHSTNSSSSREVEQGDSSRPKRKRARPMDDAIVALTTIAQSLKEMVEVFVAKSCVNVQSIIEKLKGLDLTDEDMLTLMEMFEVDEKAGRFFLGIHDEALTRSWINRKLGK